MTANSQVVQSVHRETREAAARSINLIKLVVFTIVLLIAGGVGYGIGYITYEPQVESLRGTQQELEQELVSAKSLQAQRSARLDQALTEVGDLTATRTTLDAGLQSANASLEQARTRLADAQRGLEALRMEQGSTSAALDAAEATVTELEGQVRVLGREQRNLRAAIDVQAEIMAIMTEKLGPALGDASLVALRGDEAWVRGSFGNAMKLYEDAVVAFEVAEEEASVTPAKARQLASLVPPERRDSYTQAQKQAEGRYRAVSARVPEFRAAGKLAKIIDEWVEQDQTGTAGDVERWEDLANEAEDEIEAALLLLDDAAEWSPDLWREFETQRVDLQQWRGWIDFIRFQVLVLPEEPGPPAEESDAPPEEPASAEDESESPAEEPDQPAA